MFQRSAWNELYQSTRDIHLLLLSDKKEIKVDTID